MREKLFFLFAMLSAALICGDYAITRPASNALFLTVFSAKGYPWVWLATVPLNLLLVTLYNRFLPKIGPHRMLCIGAFLIMGVNSLAALSYSSWPQVIFFQYAWKDIYVLLMLKQLWSMIHSTIPPARAKYLYGFIYGTGTLGAIGGSFIPGFLAVHFGSEKILLFSLPTYLLLIGAYTLAFKHSGLKETSFSEKLTPDPRPREALSLIRRSPVLFAVLLLVVLMQISVGLMEYQFNAHLELNIFDPDLRTAYCGKLVGLINACSLGLQCVAGIFLAIVGLRATHFLVPILLGVSALFSFAMPTFAIVSFSYVFLKAVDFSLFGVVREMLYAPLQLDEKFRAKALIDVFASRTSKAVVSLGLLLLQVVAGAYLLPLTGMLSLIIFIVWLAVVAFLFRKSAALSI